MYLDVTEHGIAITNKSEIIGVLTVKPIKI